MNNLSTIQTSLFDQIRSRLPAHLSLSDEVAQLLDVSSDSAYRRIRGEKLLDINEVQKLCIHFKISIDSVLGIDSSAYVFFGKTVDKNNFNLEQYLTEILRNLLYIKSFANKEMYYEAKDIPIFHHFQFPELAAFKFFFWMKSILQYPELAKSKFNAEDIPASLNTIGRQIITIYNEIPATEIWSYQTINSTIRQIEYCRESGVFQNNDDISLIYNQLNDLIEHIQTQAETGRKFYYKTHPHEESASYKLFLNDVYQGHNTILGITGENRITYLNHGVLNYIYTQDRSFSDFTYRSLQNTISKSNLISSVNEKERVRFFNVLKRKIEKNKIALSQL